MICGIICQGGVPGAGAATTWDPAKKHADITLSGGNLIATQTTTGNFRNVKSVAGSLTGKRYFECRLNAATTPAYVVVVGLGTVAASLSSAISSQGGSSYSCGLYADGNALNGPSGGVGTDTGKAIGVGEWAGLAVDFTAEKAWVRDATGWAGDPVAGTGNSFSFATIGLTLYAMVGGYTTGDEIEANFGASSFAYTIPSGFIAWGDGTGGGEEEGVSGSGALAVGAAVVSGDGEVAGIVSGSGALAAAAAAVAGDGDVTSGTPWTPADGGLGSSMSLWFDASGQRIGDAREQRHQPGQRQVRQRSAHHAGDQPAIRPMCRPTRMGSIRFHSTAAIICARRVAFRRPCRLRKRRSSLPMRRVPEQAAISTGPRTVPRSGA